MLRIAIGSLVCLRQPFGGLRARTLGLCYAATPERRAEDGQWSVLFEGGIPLGLCARDLAQLDVMGSADELADYHFSGIDALLSDFDQGRFDAALAKARAALLPKVA
jgi:hypothetical protein